MALTSRTAPGRIEVLEVSLPHMDMLTKCFKKESNLVTRRIAGETIIPHWGRILVDTHR